MVNLSTKRNGRKVSVPVSRQWEQKRIASSQRVKIKSFTGPNR